MVTTIGIPSTARGFLVLLLLALSSGSLVRADDTLSTEDISAAVINTFPTLAPTIVAGTEDTTTTTTTTTGRCQDTPGFTTTGMFDEEVGCNFSSFEPSCAAPGARENCCKCKRECCGLCPEGTEWDMITCGIEPSPTWAVLEPLPSPTRAPTSSDTQTCFCERYEDGRRRTFTKTCPIDVGDCGDCCRHISAASWAFFAFVIVPIVLGALFCKYRKPRSTTTPTQPTGPVVDIEPVAPTTNAKPYVVEPTATPIDIQPVVVEMAEVVHPVEVVSPPVVASVATPVPSVPTEPPKKYTKDDNGKLGLNPEYTKWKKAQNPV